MEHLDLLRLSSGDDETFIMIHIAEIAPDDRDVIRQRIEISWLPGQTIDLVSDDAPGPTGT